MLEDLNRAFGIPGRVEFFSGPADMTAVRLHHRSGAMATATLYGAHVISWRDAAARERLFLSGNAIFAPGKAIRGGIPIIFPQFGPGALPSHGFARTSNWECIGARESSDGAVAVKLRLQNSVESEKVWPHKFTAVHEIVLKDDLTTSLRVENLGAVPFNFQNAFHTYFSVGDITKVALPGLRGLEYLDNLNKRMRCKEEAGKLSIDREVDRVYLQAPDTLSIEGAVPGGGITIRKKNMSDAVVWNPWIEKSKTLNDLQPDDFKRFICVETGNIGSPIVLQPGAAAVCSQTIS